MMETEKEEGLNRSIGPVTLALNAINLTIGAGIFVLPATVAAGIGAAGFLAYLLCGLLVILIMLCFAEAGSSVVSSGGVYAYVATAFGPYPGFLINTLFWFGFSCMADAAVMNALLNMLGTIIPALNQGTVRILFMLLLLAFVAAINIRGVKSGAALAVVTTLIKLLPIFLLIIAGFFLVNTSHLAVRSWPSLDQVTSVSVILFFAFMGSESALGNSGEIRKPQRNIPLGIMLGISSVIIIYLLLHTVAQGVLGDRLAQNTAAPLVVLGREVFGAIGAPLMIFAGIISMFGLIGGDILACPRVLFAAAKDGLLPKALAATHPRYATPHIAIVIYSLMVFLFSAGLGFNALATLASSSILIIYLAAVLATIRLRKSKTQQRATFLLPGGIVIHFFAVLIIGYFLKQLAWPEWRSLLLFFAVTSVLYFLSAAARRRRKVSQSFS